MYLYAKLEPNIPSLGIYVLYANLESNIRILGIGGKNMDENVLCGMRQCKNVDTSLKDALTPSIFVKKANCEWQKQRYKAILHFSPHQVVKVKYSK